MLHMDVLLLIYHFARFGPGNILEIGPYVGGSTIAAAFGARESGVRKKIVSIEAGGSVKHFRLSSRNIIKDLKKNLVRFGVADDVTLINGRSSDATIISEVRQCLSSSEVGLFIFDADNNVRRDLDCYGDLLADRCWLVIDDYFGPAKAAPIRAQVDALRVWRVDSSRLDITDGGPGLASGSVNICLSQRGALGKQSGASVRNLTRMKLIFGGMDEIR